MVRPRLCESVAAIFDGHFPKVDGFLLMQSINSQMCKNDLTDVHN